MKMGALWSAAQAAAADAYTMGTLGMPSAVLMERASLCVAEELHALAEGLPVVSLVGPGNNGGDALAAARIVQARGLKAHAWLVASKRNAATEAQLELARLHGVQVHEDPSALPERAVWVDGLLGTGATGAPRGAIAEALVWAQGRSGPRLAIDVPSGVEVDTGATPGVAFRADVTVTFVHSKPGLHITPGYDLAGQVVIADIGIVSGPGVEAAGWLLTVDVVAALLATRPRVFAHKGSRGHVAVIGGSPDTPGAAVLAGVAAMRVGAGLCTLVGASVPSFRPELMRAPLPEGQAPVLPSASVLVVGPGLTEPPPSWFLEQLYRDDPRPAVWDASALDRIPLGVEPAGPRVITPHPGEAARVLHRAHPERGWSAAQVQAGRVEAVEALQRHSGAVVVLKGAGTLVRDRTRLAVAVEGTDALATAGAGDVLAGCIGGLLAQGLEPSAAAQAGVSVHGRTSGLAGRAPLALELADALPDAMAAIEAGRVAGRAPRIRRG